LGFPANVREAQEIERLRLPDTPLRAMLGRKTPKLDQASLVGVQFQVELRKPLTKIVEEPICITTVLEPDDEVIGEAGDDHVATSVPVSPLPDPPVEDVVQIHVG
jgi:hypothetical protein